MSSGMLGTTMAGKIKRMSFGFNLGLVEVSDYYATPKYARYALYYNTRHQIPLLDIPRMTAVLFER